MVQTVAPWQSGADAYTMEHVYSYVEWLLTFHGFCNDVDILQRLYWDVHHWVRQLADLPGPLKGERITLATAILIKNKLFSVSVLCWLSLDSYPLTLTLFLCLHSSLLNLNTNVSPGFYLDFLNIRSCTSRTAGWS